MSRMRFAGVVVGVAALATLGAETASATTVSIGSGAAEAVQAPVMRSFGDGCTRVPDSYLGANFRPACDKHDRCYSRDSSTDRLVCDKRLYVNLVKACKAEFGKYNPLRYSCIEMAGKYFLGVRAFGRSHYDGTGDPS